MSFNFKNVKQLSGPQGCEEKLVAQCIDISRVKRPIKGLKEI